MTTLRGLKLVLADSCPLFQVEFEVSMAKEGFEVVACAASPDDLPRLCEDCAPNAVITSLVFGGGYPSIGKIKNMIKACSGAGVVVLTQFNDVDLVKSLYQAGVMAVVNVSSSPSTIAEAIRHAIAGDVYFTPDIAQQLALATARGEESPRALLNQREQEVLTKGCGSIRCPIFNGTDGRIALLFLAYVACHTALGTPSTASRQHRRKWDIGCFRTPKLAVGMTLSDIATALALSLRTVSQSSVAIKSKLGINRPIEFTIYALKHRFIDIQDL